MGAINHIDNPERDIAIPASEESAEIEGGSVVTQIRDLKAAELEVLDQAQTPTDVVRWFENVMVRLKSTLGEDNPQLPRVSEYMKQLALNKREEVNNK